MLPEALRSIPTSRLSSVFEHSITWEDDVWRADPFDVSGVHGAARRKFTDLVTAVAEGHGTVQNRILLFHGQSGAGKTHLIRALRTQTHKAHRGYFGYAQMTPDVANYAEYFLRRLVNSLEKPYDPDDASESGLMRLSNNLVNRSGALSPGSRELLKESALDNERLAWLIIKLADEIVASPKFKGLDLDINVVRALLYLQRNDPRIDQRVRQFLYGRQLSDPSRPLVGALETHEGQDRAYEMISCLGRLMKIIDGAALVICIDQVEDLSLLDNPEDRFQSAVRDLIQIANSVSSSIIVMACLDDFYARVRSYLSQSYVDRIEKGGPILLSEVRSEDEARLIVTKRLQKALADEGAGNATPQVIDALGPQFFAELKGLPTRRLLEHAQRRWREFLGEVPADDPAPVVRIVRDDDAALAVKARWDRHIQDSQIEIPSEESELTRILIAALRLVAEEACGVGDVEINALDGFEEVAAFDLSVRLQGHDACASRVFVCNRSNQGGGLKRQLERVILAAEGRNSYLVRTSDFPPAGKGVAAQLATRIVNQGGRRLVIPSYEWERMLNMLDFHSRAHREPGYAEWLAVQQPLSALPSVREILRLDLLAPKAQVPSKSPKPAVSVVSMPSGGRRAGTAHVPSAAMLPAGGGGGLWSRMFGAFSQGNAAVQNDNAPVHGERLDVAGNLATVARYDDSDDDEIIDLSELLGDPEPLESGAYADRFAAPEIVDAPEADGDRFIIGHATEDGHTGITLTKNILRRHAAVLGGSGSGKTTLALSMVEQLLLRGIPVVLIDRKGDLCSYAHQEVWRGVSGEATERRAMREQLSKSIDVAVYTPGRTTGRPINITLLPTGIAELPGHEQQLLANVSAAAIGEMLHLKHSATHQRMSGILAVALKVLGSKSRNEVRLNDLIRLLEDDDEELVELTQRMDPTGRARRDLMGQLDSLRHRNAALFDGHGEPLRMDALLGLGPYAKPQKTRLSIVYTGFLGDNENVLFWVSQFLSEALRFCQRNPSERLQAVIMFDEADLYIPSSSKPATKDPLESLLKRARSAGVGIMLATQSPGDLDYRSRDQVTSWFIGRVREDTALKKLRAAFQSESGLDPSRVLPNQTVGEFHLIQEGRVKAMKSRRSLISAEQVPFDKIEQLAREMRKHEAQQLKLDLG